MERPQLSHGKLLALIGLDGLSRDRVDAGRPVWGTCAGTILLATDVGDSGSRIGPPQPLLGPMDIRVRCNAFGAPLESFETTLDAPVVVRHPVPAVFVRTPEIEAVGPAGSAARHRRYFLDEVAAAGSRRALPPIATALG